MEGTKTESLKQLLLETHLTIESVIFSSSRSCVLAVQNAHKKTLILKIRPVNNAGLRHENKVLSSLDHPNIVKREAFIENKEFCCLLMEKVPGEPLIELIKARGAFPEDVVKDIIMQLEKVLCYLYCRGLVHLDLKPDNIMFDPQSKRVTLIDFENVYEFSNSRNFTKLIGTPEYCSPEVNQGRFRGPEAMMWSLGVTTHVLLTGTFPEFQTSIKAKNHWLLLQKKVKTCEVKCPDSLSTESRNLLEHLLSPDPRHRLTLEQLHKKNLFVNSLKV